MICYGSVFKFGIFLLCLHFAFFLFGYFYRVCTTFVLLHFQVWDIIINAVSWFGEDMICWAWVRSGLLGSLGEIGICWVWARLDFVAARSGFVGFGRAQDLMSRGELQNLRGLGENRICLVSRFSVMIESVSLLFDGHARPFGNIFCSLSLVTR